MIDQNIVQILFPIIILLFSVIIHELSHGYVAYILGDDTAYNAGRLTLNPISHLDMVGSIIVPVLSIAFGGVFIGWAKPVPYNPRNIKSRYGEAFVASAGVISNFALAVISIIAYKLLSINGILNENIGRALFIIIAVNISLACFNLMPIPPFDGMSILQSLFPRLNFLRKFSYNPVYLIGAILVASVFYSYLANFIFGFIIKILS